MNDTTSRWTEAKVFDALRHVFPSPAHVRLSSVRNGTGYSRKRTRTADGIVFSTWPSRGLWMAGVEIKVSRSDWKKELSDPSKADEIQQYCNHWFVAAPQGVVPVEEVPKTWGLIECAGNSAKIVKCAPDLEAKQLDLLLTCAIFRSVTDAMTPTASVQAEIERAVAKAKEEVLRDVAGNYELKRIKEAVAKFEKASGVQIGMRWESGDIGRAVKIVQKIGYDDSIKRLRDNAVNAKRIANDVMKLIDDSPAVVSLAVDDE